MLPKIEQEFIIIAKIRITRSCIFLDTVFDCQIACYQDEAFIKSTIFLSDSKR